MQKNRLTLAVLGLSSALLATAPLHAQEKPAASPAAPAPAEVKPTAPAPIPDPVAVVNGVAISRATYQAYAGQRARQMMGADPASPEVRKELTGELVMQELLVQQADKAKLGDSAEVKAQLDMLKRNVLATAAVREFLKTHEPSEAMIKAEYDKAVAEMKTKEYKARHILVDAEDKAKKLIEELNKGAKFDELAKANSKDPSKDQGGDLGWFGPDMMVEPFAAAVAKLEKGKYTAAPVQTPFGWHVILLEDTRDATPPAIDELKPQITQMLQGKAINEYLESLKKDAKVEVK